VARVKKYKIVDIKAIWGDIFWWILLSENKKGRIWRISLFSFT